MDGWRGWGLGLLATVFWASLYVVTRLLFRQFHGGSLTLTFLRFLMANVFFVGLAAVMGRGEELFRALVRHGWTAFAFLGLTGVFREGAAVFDPTSTRQRRAVVCFANASPILTALIAAMLLKNPHYPAHGRRNGRQGLLAMILGMGGQAGSDQFAQAAAVAWAICWR